MADEMEHPGSGEAPLPEKDADAPPQAAPATPNSSHRVLSQGLSKKSNTRNKLKQLGLTKKEVALRYTLPAEEFNALKKAKRKEKKEEKKVIQNVKRKERKKRKMLVIKKGAQMNAPPGNAQ